MARFNMAVLSTQSVVRYLKETLPRSVFVPRPRRLGWFALHLAVVLTVLTVAMLRAFGLVAIPWFSLPLAGLVAGGSFAGLAFVAHETLHGAVVRGARLKKWIGQIAWAPFCLSADLWMAWHNRTHHPHTNVADRDPDAYPDLESYRSNPWARRFVEVAAPGNGRLRGLITLLGGFTVQGLQVLFTARQKGIVSPRLQRKVWLQTSILVGFWLAWAVIVGPWAALCLYVLPLIVGNAVVMGYIVTNHSLHRGVDVDDALSTTLSVEVPRWYDMLCLQFGYHVEHHLLPTVSHAHGPLIQRALLELVPERYSHMTLVEAWRRIVRTPRVRRDQVWLVDPSTGRSARALGAPSSAIAARARPAGVVTAPSHGTTSVAESNFLNSAPDDWVRPIPPSARSGSTPPGSTIARNSQFPAGG